MKIMATIYLDNSATTPMHPSVIEKMTHAMTTFYGNPSSVHHLGRESHAQLTKARQQLAKSIHANEDDIILTSGGTEGDNTAIFQTAYARQSLGKHIITSSVEHPAVSSCMTRLAEEGFAITYLPVNAKGELTIEQVSEALREDTILVSLMWTNNETGVMFPIKEVADLLQEHQAYFHTDAVQAYGIEEIDVTECPVDLLSVSGHKINGPKGTGFLYVKSGLSLPSFMVGGDQEEKRRAGTENLPGIIGLAEAATLLTTSEKADRQARYLEFQEMIINRLESEDIDFEVNGQTSHKSAHILNLWFKGISSNMLLMHLDLKGVAISIGSACTAGTIKPSHVLEAMDVVGCQRATESVRLSFGYSNTPEEITEFLDLLVPILKRLAK